MSFVELGFRRLSLFGLSYYIAYRKCRNDLDMFKTSLRTLGGTCYDTPSRINDGGFAMTLYIGSVLRK